MINIEYNSEDNVKVTWNGKSFEGIFYYDDAEWWFYYFETGGPTAALKSFTGDIHNKEEVENYFKNYILDER